MKSLTEEAFIELVGRYATVRLPFDERRGLLVAMALRELHAGGLDRETLVGEADLHDTDEPVVRGFLCLMVHDRHQVWLAENLHALSRRGVLEAADALAQALPGEADADEDLIQKVRGAAETRAIIMCAWLTNDAGDLSVNLYRHRSLTPEEGRRCFKIFLQELREQSRVEDPPVPAPA